jgi:hypothetical protein
MDHVVGLAESPSSTHRFGAPSYVAPA